MSAYRLAWDIEHGVDANGDPVVVEVEVVYRYQPAGFECIDDTGRYDYPVGPEVEINDVIGSDGKAVTVTADERQALERHILANPPYLGLDPDDARDRVIEDRKFFAGERGYD